MSQITEILAKIKDQHLKIGVAVEGGGLRGVVSLAMLKFFKDFSLDRQISAIAGTSAGAINAAYFLNDSIDHGLELYKEMASSEFLQPLKFPNAMNLDFLFLDRIPNHHPFDEDVIRNHPTKFFVTVTRVASGKTRAIWAQQALQEVSLLKLLRASAAAPLFSAHKEEIFGELYNDGHVEMPIPYQPLLKEPVDYIFCLRTQKDNYRKQDSLLGQFHRTISMATYDPRYRHVFGQSGDLYNQQLDFITSDPQMLPVVLEDGDPIPAKNCQDPAEMEQAFENTYKKFMKLS